MAAPETQKSVGETGHSKQHNSFFTPSPPLLVNYMQVFSFLLFFFVVFFVCRSNKNVTEVHKARNTVKKEGRDSVEEVAECAA